MAHSSVCDDVSVAAAIMSYNFCEDNLDGGLDAIVRELEPHGIFFPQPKQDVHEVLTPLPCAVGPLLLVRSQYLGHELVPRIGHVVELLIEARRPSHKPRRRVRQHVLGLEAGHQRRRVPHELLHLLGCCPGGTRGSAGDHRVGVAVHELHQHHCLPSLRGAADPCDESCHLGVPHRRERLHAARGEEVDHGDLLAPAPALTVRRERDVGAAVHQLVPCHAVRAGGEGEVVVPEQVRGCRGRGHDQRPPTPELQEEEAAAAAVAKVQLVQGSVCEAADEVKVSDQRQRRRRRRELATPAVLDDVEEEDNHAGGSGEQVRRHLLCSDE
ncbi:hypothetical protein U9M48_014986 [Paspalum notatum var. saurae]|uniref:Uncharacterized protein n=1 Tax=Paspalum notatum var. saurae TaxID=547442 RepID=A0AAQ3T3Z3_PASNO